MRVGFRCGAVALLVSAAAPGLASLLGRAEPAPEGYLRITVTTPLPAGRVPLDPEVDFTALRRRLGLPGVLDPDSVRVTDGETGRAIPHALSDEFQFGDRGRVEWSALRPSQRVFDLRFRTVPLRPAPRARGLSLPIGVGDLLRYGGGQRRPLALPYLSRLVDLTGDGRADLVGCWNYAHRPGRPWDGIFCFPRRPGARYEFGDPIRLRHAVGEDSTTLEEFSSIYMQADLADLDGDRRPDLVYSPRRGSRLELFRNTGRRDAGGMPIFAPAGTLPRPEGAWEPCRAVDLNGDGAVDLVVGDWYLQNSGAPGWPLRTAAPVALGAGPRACFLDLDQDERLDAVSLEETGRPGEPQGHRVVWRRNEGAASPRFSEARPLAGVDPFWCSDLAATTEGNQPVLLVQHKVFQEVSLYTPGPPRAGEPVLRRLGRAESRNTLLALSDQAWPCVCDWNDDGRLDLLVGGGYGWPRILLNRGTSTAPRYTEPQPILSEGRPIRLLMAEIFPGCNEYRHNMGYPYPAFVDWDGDGRSDLMLPNCSNRIFWYRNIGTRKEPRFGPRRQLNPDGYEDTPAKRRATGRILMARWEGELEPGQPFFWRTGAAFADFTGDGLMDLVTHDGATRTATLFSQYRAADGTLRLRKADPLRLEDGRLIDDTLVGRRAHWTESFRAVDWDRDGRLDLIYSCAGSTPAGSIYLLRNTGTRCAPVFAAPRTLRCFGEPIYVTAHGPHPWAGDLDGDGQPDLLTCVEWSVYPFFNHNAIKMPKRPTFRIELRHP